MELRKILEIIRRRKWIIIQAFFIISLTAIIGSFLIPPVYKTSSKVLIKTSDTASSLLESIGLSTSTFGVTTTETPLETHMELITLKPVLNTVISKLQLRRGDGSLMEAEGLQKRKLVVSTFFPNPYVQITQVENTDIMEIEASSTDPEEAAMIADTVSRIYIEENLRQTREEYRRARIFIEDRINMVKNEYLDVLEGIKTFKIRNKTVDLEKETKVAIDRMADLMNEQEKAIINLSEARAKIETLRDQLQRQEQSTVSSSAIVENPQIELLKKNLSSFQLELAGMLVEKRLYHPDVVALKQKIELTKKELEKEVETFKDSSKDLETMERELAALEVRLRGITADIEGYLPLLYAIPQKVFTQSQMELRLSVSQDLYKSLLEYLYQVGIAEAMILSDTRLVEDATVPDIDRPASPKRAVHGVVGIFLGLMFGFGLAFLNDYLDDTIEKPEEVKEAGLILLGATPRFRKKDEQLISQRDPKDPITETYRTVRNSLKFASLDRPINSILITSCLENEGKTYSAANLGISMTREGKRVLLIDTDLRRPTLHTVFGASNLTGITNILSGEESPDSAIKKTHVDGLSLLTSGPVPLDPGRIVESAKMRQLMENFKQQYDIIILDTPPILVANDPLVLSGYVDDSILVLESEKVTRRALSETLELLNTSNIRPIGAILTKVKVKGRRYYYSYYYKSGYYKGKKA